MAHSKELIRGRHRVGGRVLPLIADAVNVSIMRALTPGELKAQQLTARLEHVSRSTQFERLRDLEEMRVITRETLAVVPRQSAYRLTEAGEALLRAVAPVETWLAEAEPESLGLGEPGATEPLKVLSSALNSTVLRWLAERDRSPTELEQLVEGGGYLDLKRVLRGLKRAGLAEQRRSTDRRHPYRLTPWARRSAAAIGAMARWESDYVPGTGQPLCGLDVEGLFLLAAPLIKVPNGGDGTCAMVVKGLGAVSIAVDSGRVTRWAPGIASELTGWACGRDTGWRAAVVGGTFSALQVDGDNRFVVGMVKAMCRALSDR